jgi:bacteriorhodopsin
MTLVLASGLPLSDIVTLVFFDIVMVVTGLISALVKSRYKWGFYTFGCVAMFYIFWVLFGPARKSAGVLGAGYQSAFTKASVMLAFLWTLYPVAFGLNDGGNVTSPDSEMIFYGILDLMAKPVFTLFHLYSLSKLDLTALQLSSGKFSSTAVGAGIHDVEKSGRFGTATGTTGTAVPAKKGFFSKRGHHDAAPVAGAPVTSEPAMGRPSEATVVSH